MGGNPGDMWVDYGVPRRVPNSARTYTLTNEQCNFISNLVVGTNDIFSFQIPYPFYVDQREEAVVFHKIDFILRRNPLELSALSTQQRLTVDLQYSDKEPAADWNGLGEDVEDENIQAMFDGPFMIGLTGWSKAPDADATVPMVAPGLQLTNVHYYPPDFNGLDAFFPVTAVLMNNSYDRDLVDQTADAADFGAQEGFYVRPYFTTRKLTAQEKDMMTSEYYGLVPNA